MFMPPALSVSLWLLAADPGDAAGAAQPAAPANGPATDKAHALAQYLGHTIGTAMECAVGQNMDGDEARAEQMLDKAALDSGEDPIEIEDRFHDAMAEGRDQVLDNRVDCSQANAALEKFEGEKEY